MACLPCGREFHSECDSLDSDTNSCCCSTDLSNSDDQKATASEPKTKLHTSQHDEVSISAGRKRAAREYDIDENKPCEWRGKVNCGGGFIPVPGCAFGFQVDRHHGPDKNTTNNSRDNIHLICKNCLVPWTPILKYDLTWQPAEFIKEGDELLAFSEEIKGRGNRITFEKSTVESVERVLEPAYKFTMANGKIIISSHNHKWVSSSPGRHHISWRQSQALKVGYNLRYLVDPWETDKSWEAGWLAGILDGEGSIDYRQISVSQKEDFLVIDYIQSELERRVKGQIHYTNRPAQGSSQQAWVLRVANLADIMTLLGTVRPHRLLQQFYSKYKILEKNPLVAQKDNKVAINAIEFVGTREVISIQTSSGTLIANGFLSHNCHNLWHRRNDPLYGEAKCPDGIALHLPTWATFSEIPSLIVKEDV